jgi:hypothetical protein
MLVSASTHDLDRLSFRPSSSSGYRVTSRGISLRQASHIVIGTLVSPRRLYPSIVAPGKSTQIMIMSFNEFIEIYQFLLV